MWCLLFKINEIFESHFLWSFCLLPLRPFLGQISGGLALGDFSQGGGCRPGVRNWLVFMTSSEEESCRAQDAIRDLVVVGAGPHALACVSRLIETKSRFYTDHDLTTKRKYYQEVDEEKKPLDVVVVDPAGSWLARWHSQFDQMKIKFLRSPVTAHPGMFRNFRAFFFAIDSPGILGVVVFASTRSVGSFG